MLALPLRSCLIAATLLLPAAVLATEPAHAPDQPAAPGQPLDLVPPPAPVPARHTPRHASHPVRVGPNGRSALIDPVFPTGGDHAAAPSNGAAKTGMAGQEGRTAEPESRTTVPASEPNGAATPADLSATRVAALPEHAGAAAEPVRAEARGKASPAVSPALAAVPQGASEMATASPADPRPVSTLKGPAAEPPSRPAPLPAPLPAAPVQPVTVAAVEPEGSGTPAATRPAPGNDTQAFCSAIAGAAADARFAWQRKQITDLEAELKARIAELDAKGEEVKAVLARRDALMKKATDTVVGLYAGMKPDAAAEQIAALDDDMAAAVLAQLPQRKASQILNQIPAEKAAKLVAAIATVVPPEKKS